MISNPDFSLFFFSNHRQGLVLKIPFHDQVFPKPQNTVLKIFISRPQANTKPSPENGAFTLEITR